MNDAIDVENLTTAQESVTARATVQVEEAELPLRLEHAEPYSVQHEVRKILASLSGLLAICVILWLAFYALAQRFPYVMVGSAAVYNAKELKIANSQLLDDSKPVRILAFGSSKVLSGFVPAAFEQSVPNTSSYNLGLPATEHFMPELETLLVRGERPTHILVTVPWADPKVHKNTIFHFPDDDAAVLATVFPFRTWVHDSFILLYRSPQFGGVKATYLQAEHSIQSMNADQGYYFIAGESHYPNNQLPSDFHLDSDQPQAVEVRKLNTSLASFRRLNELAQQYNFRVLVVPTYYRPGQWAPVSGVNSTEIEAVRSYDRFKVVGPDYYTYDRKYFSDHLHLNPTGAQLYTKDLAQLVAGELQGH